MPYYIIAALFFLSCTTNDTTHPVLSDTTIIQTQDSVSVENYWFPAGATLEQRFPEPMGYQRIDVEENSFGSYLRNFRLKKDTARVYLYDGSPKWNQENHISVLDIDVGKKDLQQCADAVMRLRAEYFYDQKLYSQIQFHLTNGFKMEYTKWMEGYRVRVKGNKTNWYKAKPASNTYSDFRSFMTFVFIYAGTYSLEKELKPKSLEQIYVGDVFIQGGFPGHAIIVMDVVENMETKERKFMIAQSYMPAQDIHLLLNLEYPSNNWWFSNQQIKQIITPEWTFNTTDLKSW